MINSDFFDKPKTASQVKSELVKKYFWAWGKIIAPRTNNRIAYIDLYAGKGTYDDGSKSTPILVLENALRDEKMRNKLIAIFNDINPAFSKSLIKEIDEIPDISELKYKPKVFNYDVANDIVNVLLKLPSIPSLLFVDPWGYKGLTRELLYSSLKNWGSDCIFFFNYNRINAGLYNKKFIDRMNNIFGTNRVVIMKERLKSIRSPLLCEKFMHPFIKRCIAFGTHEWADENYNFINGCIHDCKYCYSKEMAIRFKRKTADNWCNEEIRKGRLDKKFTKRKGTIMFPSSHDITPKHINETIKILSKLLSVGNSLLIVTKPHLECIEQICSKFEEYKNQIIFRFTIGSSDTGILKFWEPGAPSFEERFECLKLAFDLGFTTSVSCEPMVDTNPEILVDRLLPYISDTIWLGKANFLLKRMRTNGVKDEASFERARELIAWQSNDDNILSLYSRYENNPKIEWKESIKKVINNLIVV